ncbi:MAG: McrC family protein [Candidatus Promineifilaceae bacterium]
MVFVVQEFEPIHLDAHALSHAEARHLQTQYATQLAVQWLFEREQWQLSAKGWVGAISLGRDELLIRPKIPLANLYHLLEVADNLPLRYFSQITHGASISDFYERLAAQLAKRILRRVQVGLFQAHQSKSARLPYVRGRLAVAKMRPGQLAFPVTYSEVSADNPHNQLLLATLQIILRTHLLSNQTRQLARQAYRKLSPQVSLVSFPMPLRTRLNYSRLNAEYEQMHVLCCFFLRHTMPHHERGSAATLPFLVDMAALFERFVAQWLQKNLPAAYQLRVQERSGVAGGKIQMAIDLVIVERATGQVKMVLDTKWKSAEKPANQDIYQVAFYANSCHSPEAVLIYPSQLAQPFDETIRDVRLRTLTFDVSDSIDNAGKKFMIELFTKK